MDNYRQYSFRSLTPLLIPPPHRMKDQQQKPVKNYTNLHYSLRAPALRLWPKLRLPEEGGAPTKWVAAFLEAQPVTRSQFTPARRTEFPNAFALQIIGVSLAIDFHPVRN